MKKFIIFISACVMSIACNADVLPTNIDLKAAYCAGIMMASEASRRNLEAMYTQANEAPPELLKQQRRDADRLRSYLLPRLQHLDTEGIEAAISRGRQDYSDRMAEINACTANCGSFNGSSARCYKQCGTSENQLKSRVTSCNDLSWLPF